MVLSWFKKGYERIGQYAGSLAKKLAGSGNAKSLANEHWNTIYSTNGDLVSEFRDSASRYLKESKKEDDAPPEITLEDLRNTRRNLRRLITEELNNASCDRKKLEKRIEAFNKQIRKKSEPIRRMEREVLQVARKFYNQVMGTESKFYRDDSGERLSSEQKQKLAYEFSRLKQEARSDEIVAVLGNYRRDDELFNIHMREIDRTVKTIEARTDRISKYEKESEKRGSDVIYA
jgi:hypothetical protein